MKCIESLDGRFVHSPETRAAACASLGHPKQYINLSVSAKVGREIRQCHCGVANEAPEALKAYRKAKRAAASAARGKT